VKVTVGTHVLGNLYGCPKEQLEKVQVVRDLLKKTVQEANLHSVGESFHQFEPVGVTGVIVLSESHFSIHTWPEKNMAVVDVFTCGNEGNAKEAFDILCKHLNPERVDKKVVER
jgi:S-adenosylmethionine decarboxylase